jgi:hypothetical protein
MDNDGENHGRIRGHIYVKDWVLGRSQAMRQYPMDGHVDLTTVPDSDFSPKRGYSVHSVSRLVNVSTVQYFLRVHIYYHSMHVHDNNT